MATSCSRPMHDSVAEAPCLRHLAFLNFVAPLLCHTAWRGWAFLLRHSAWCGRAVLPRHGAWRGRVMLSCRCAWCDKPDACHRKHFLQVSVALSSRRTCTKNHRPPPLIPKANMGTIAMHQTLFHTKCIRSNIVRHTNITESP
jgi:hypothetical protein